MLPLLLVLSPTSSSSLFWFVGENLPPTARHQWHESVIKISDKYGEMIELIGISIDFPDEVESKIIPFLNKLKPNFINYVNVENDTERFINNLNPGWSGAIPATFFYDSEGKQFLFYEVKMSFKEIENEVLKMIN